MIHTKVLKSLMPIIMPPMTAWAQRMEREIFSYGKALSDSEISDAIELGVMNPERVRYMIVDEIPLPAEELAALAQQAGIIDADTEGMAYRYGIFIRSDVKDKRLRLLHELVHVAQYERLGEIRNFIREYVTACLDHGYAKSPFEIEARQKSQKLAAESSGQTRAFKEVVSEENTVSAECCEEPFLFGRHAGSRLL
ncbi:MAG TPA: hypothetical protein VMG59_01025 [Phycisphaerae bacterium]|nr:hypothetical protein [Phycisphaerae bacterium]